MANETELAEEKKRHAEGHGAFLYALNTSERKRLEKFKETCQFFVVDVKT